MRFRSTATRITLPIVCLASLAAGAASGNEVVKVPLARTAPQLVEMKPYFFTTPDGPGFLGNTQGVVGTYSKETGEKLVASLSRRRGFEAVNKEPIVTTARAGEKAKVEILREFVYPTEYLPPEIKPAKDGGLPRVTPATPNRFETKNLGVSLTYSGRRQKDGDLSVSLDFKRAAFFGFVNYGKPIRSEPHGLFRQQVVMTENRIEMPVFSSMAMKSSLRLKSGDFIVINCPQFQSAEQLSPSGKGKPVFEAWKGEPASAGKNFIALIQVRERDATGR